ncbi:hypothetical protein RUM43_000953 [Polyplax serrata]|uniref:C2H2-type domain-containing protein n=1 Tax=Polyplax serrata TaxID=468196 RepID=A0AAN8SD79_POLSC
MGETPTHESNENSEESQGPDESPETKGDGGETQQSSTAGLTVIEELPVTVSENPDSAGFHFLSHEYFEKANQDSINEIIDSLPKARSDLLEYLVKSDGTVVCKWCGEVLPSRTHWYRHKYKLHIPTAGLPAGLIKCIKCNTFFKSRKGYVGHCISRHGSVEEAEKEDEDEHMIIKEEKLVIFEEENVEDVSENIEKEEANRKSNKFLESYGRGRKKSLLKSDEKKEDYLKQREKEEKLVADIIAKVKKECEDQSITMCRRGYSRRSTVMTSFREYDKRK